MRRKSPTTTFVVWLCLLAVLAAAAVGAPHVFLLPAAPLLAEVPASRLAHAPESPSPPDLPVAGAVAARAPPLA